MPEPRWLLRLRRFLLRALVLDHLHRRYLDLIGARIGAAFKQHMMAFMALHDVRVGDGPDLAVISDQRLAVLADGALYPFRRGATLAHRVAGLTLGARGCAVVLCVGLCQRYDRQSQHYRESKSQRRLHPIPPVIPGVLFPRTSRARKH